jgi:hypothetical protein
MKLEQLQPGLLVASFGGLGLGALTVRWVASLYPPTRDHWWPLVAVATASMVVILVLYLTATVLDVRRAGDWLVLGYTAALLIAASVVITEGFVSMVRDRVPESIGVKTAAVTNVECSG